ncbi:hypothetical protein Nepgr_021692 [Nepenthes gracilis]|uniref:Uncharacterized protein n=1 Tax=Nepenthes gracilis TaxID=150966 RepID=A0AAD3T1C1_NEPGR|nr:hypothetical protein Nepgr_021692 [Nepenthes gracilis]
MAAETRHGGETQQHHRPNLESAGFSQAPPSKMSTQIATHKSTTWRAHRQQSLQHRSICTPGNEGPRRRIGNSKDHHPSAEHKGADPVYTINPTSQSNNETSPTTKCNFLKMTRGIHSSAFSVRGISETIVIQAKTIIKRDIRQPNGARQSSKKLKNQPGSLAKYNALSWLQSKSTNSTLAIQ